MHSKRALLHIDVPLTLIARALNASRISVSDYKVWNIPNYRSTCAHHTMTPY